MKTWKRFNQWLWNAPILARLIACVLGILIGRLGFEHFFPPANPPVVIVFKELNSESKSALIKGTVRVVFDQIAPQM